MNVYLVRHGETILNAQGVHQPAEAKLSEEGIKQASFLANRLSDVPLDLIFSSTLHRAKQTAKIIAEKKNLEIELTQLFDESKRPTEIEGKAKDDPEVVKIKREIIEHHATDENWRHSDEETFYEFKHRMIEAKKVIEGQENENILVITHAQSMVMLLAVVLLGENLTSPEFIKITKTFMVTNSGITKFEFKNNNWTLITWNDIAHIG
jgi:broad specificity phosphatase PhoE